MTYMCDIICKEDEKSRDNEVCMRNVIVWENVNDCMCAVPINTEVKIESNLQLESFSILFKLFRVTVLICKFVEKLKHRVKTKIKQVENKIENNVSDINFDIINGKDIHAPSHLVTPDLLCVSFEEVW